MPAHGTHVRLRGLGKTLGARPILQEINLEIAPGEFVAIVGKSGCGKTTLLRLIAGLSPASAGEVLVDDSPLRGLNAAARLMFQDARLLPWKRLGANVRLGLGREWWPQADEALGQVGLGQRAGDWPAALSGGERQRVALARALATSPALLLLDEPLGALDALTRLEMQQLLEQVWLERRFTAVLVTHDVEEAIALADRVLLIEHRRVALDLPIALPRPRRRGSPEFALLTEQVLGHVLGWRREAAGA
ncbi:MAG TPA: ATP-binding cassette domain-containing protein [Herpetosiphonaceae bacterium]